MQDLLALGYYATGSYCLVIGDTLGVSKKCTTRVSKVLCAMGLLGRDHVLFPTSDAKGVSTMLLSHIKYRITHILFPTLYAAITNELICWKRCFYKMRIAANQV